MPSELSDTAAVAVYLEIDFHDNKDIAKWIINNVDSIGQSIAKGVCKADGKTYIKPSGADVDVFYRVQVGAFNRKEYADALQAKLKKQGYSDAFVVEVKR